MWRLKVPLVEIIATAKEEPMLANLSPIPELYVSHESAQKLKVEAADLISWDLTPRQICDLELLMNGGFNPLKGFLSEADYNSVVETMRLEDGSLWPMPITGCGRSFAEKLNIGQDIALRDQKADPRNHDRHRSLDARQSKRSKTCLWHR